jgi:hypothetical protein
MATLSPDEGLEWFVERALDEGGVSNEEIYDIAVGSGTASLSSTDTQLDQEEYRAKDADSNVAIINTSPQTGEIECRITISGGTEVPAGTSITEFGVFARDPTIDENSVTDSDDTLVHRELRPSITLESGDRKTFVLTISVIND